ncbi:MAG: FlgD immunoglobulin-like domain containing protein [Candidatus Latescibacterota bacterium]
MYETSGTDEGEIVDADVVLNDDVYWTVGTHQLKAQEPYDTLDVQSVVTHELGHVIGLSHPDVGCATMASAGTHYSSCKSEIEALGARSLETDDTDGLDELYITGDAGNNDGRSVRGENGYDGNRTPKPVADQHWGRPSLTLLRTSPNPANPGTSIRLELPAAVIVAVVVRDAAGQRVRTILKPANLESGYYEYWWDGRDDEGRAVGSGFYLVTLTAGTQVRAVKAALLR